MDQTFTGLARRSGAVHGNRAARGFVPATPRVMARLARVGSLIRIVPVLLTALVLATLVRGLTSELNQTAGRLWPFSLIRCDSQRTPGCPGARDPVGLGHRLAHATGGLR